jgi:uncharacterized protein (TIGR03067 family)
MLPRKLSIAALLVLAALACGGDDSSARQPKPLQEVPDSERLQGTWKLEKQMFFGEERIESSLQLTFLKNKVEYQTKTTLWQGTVKIDPNSQPKTMDLVFFDQYTMRWIYRLEGDKLVIAEPNGWFGPRPKDFTSPKGDLEKFVSTFARAKVKKDVGTVDEVAAKDAKMKRARLECGGNMQRIVMAMHKYVEEHNHWPLPATVDTAAKPLLSWRVAILPYLGEKKLYEQFHQDEPWDSAHNRKLLAKMPKVYASVGNPGKDDRETFYQVFVGDGCAFEMGKKIRSLDFEDGTVNTLALVAAGTAVPWTKPADFTCDAGKPLPPITGGMINDGLVSLAFAGGSVVITRNTVDEKILRMFVQRSSGIVRERELLEKGE